MLVLQPTDSQSRATSVQSTGSYCNYSAPPSQALPSVSALAWAASKSVCPCANLASHRSTSTLPNCQWLSLHHPTRPIDFAIEESQAPSSCHVTTSAYVSQINSCDNLRLFPNNTIWFDAWNFMKQYIERPLSFSTKSKAPHKRETKLQIAAWVCIRGNFRVAQLSIGAIGPW